MDAERFIELAKKHVAMEYTTTSPSDWCVVWLSKVAQNNKLMLSTDAIEGKYVEVTLIGGGNTPSLHLDFYTCVSNKVAYVEA